MRFPDYQGGGTLNLMTSLGQALGLPVEHYRPCRLLPPELLREARHILLLVVDGLGQDFLTGPGCDSSLHAHRVGALDSVAPPTTASAIPTFLTGMPPAAHGFTGWYMWLRELGCVTTVLPFVSRYGRIPLDPAHPGPRALSGAAPLSERLAVACRSVTPRRIAGSTFNRAFSVGTRLHPYDDMADFFKQIRRALSGRRERRYVYAYWAELDALAHRYGIASPEVRQHFTALDAGFGLLLERLAGSGTAVIVTADHGFVDSPPARHVRLEEHPELAHCLTLPLCGEPRFAYCYVRASRRSRFEDLVQRELTQQAELVDSAELVRSGLFGPPPHHPRLLDRVGDYVLCMRDDWTIKDRLPGERDYEPIGAHGGLSRAELAVPLVFVQT
jgi:hypothetical protein